MAIIGSDLLALKSLNIPTIKIEENKKFSTLPNWRTINHTPTLDVTDCYMINFGYDEKPIKILRDNKEYYLCGIDFDIKVVEDPKDAKVIQKHLEEVFKGHDGWTPSFSGQGRHWYLLVDPKKVEDFFFFQHGPSFKLKEGINNPIPKFKHNKHDKVFWEIFCVCAKQMRVANDAKIGWKNLPILTEELWKKLLAILGIELTKRITHEEVKAKKREPLVNRSTVEKRSDQWHKLLEVIPELKHFIAGDWEAFNALPQWKLLTSWDIIQNKIAPLFKYYFQWESFLNLFKTHPEWKSYRFQWENRFPDDEEIKPYIPSDVKNWIDKYILDIEPDKDKKLLEAVQGFIENYQVMNVNNANTIASADILYLENNHFVLGQLNDFRQSFWYNILDVVFESTKDKNKQRPIVERHFCDFIPIKKYSELQNDMITKIGFKNGWFDVNARKFVSFEQSGYNYTPTIYYYDFDYNAEWTPEKNASAELFQFIGACENFFTREIFENILAMLFDLTSNKRVACAFHGPSQFGKSSFLDFIAKCIGKGHTFYTSLEELNKEFHLDRLKDATLLIATENEQHKEINNTVLKKITSSEETTINSKFKAPFVVKPVATCFFATNDMMQFRGISPSDGILTRMFIFEWNQFLFGKEKEFDTKYQWYMWTEEAKYKDLRHSFIQLCLYHLAKKPRGFNYREEVFKNSELNQKNKLLETTDTFHQFLANLKENSDSIIFWGPDEFGSSKCYSIYDNRRYRDIDKETNKMEVFYKKKALSDDFFIDETIPKERYLYCTNEFLWKLYIDFVQKNQPLSHVFNTSKTIFLKKLKQCISTFMIEEERIYLGDTKGLFANERPYLKKIKLVYKSDLEKKH